MVDKSSKNVKSKMRKLISILVLINFSFVGLIFLFLINRSIDFPISKPHSAWFSRVNSDYMEHSILKDRKIYVPSVNTESNTGGLWIFNFTTGELIKTLIPSVWLCCAPVIDSEGYIHAYSYKEAKIYKLNETTESIIKETSVIGSAMDFESMGWDYIDDALIVPTSTGLRAYWCSDHSTRWTKSLTLKVEGNEYQCGSPLVLEDYVYFKDNDDGIFYQLNRTTCEEIGTVTGLGAYAISYSSPIYDPDHDYVYTIGAINQLHAIDVKTMTKVWTRTFTEDFTNPEIKYNALYHKNKVFLPVREMDSNYISMIYCLDYATGNNLWSSSHFYDLNEMVTIGLVTDDYLIYSGLSYADKSVGHLALLHIGNGLIYRSYLQKYGATCAGVSNGASGYITINMRGGWFELVKIAEGDYQDNLYYSKNKYHNGYLSSFFFADGEEEEESETWLAENLMTILGLLGLFLMATSVTLAVAMIKSGRYVRSKHSEKVG